MWNRMRMKEEEDWHMCSWALIPLRGPCGMKKKEEVDDGEEKKVEGFFELRPSPI